MTSSVVSIEIAVGWVQAVQEGPQAAVGSAALGTVLGAAAGAAIGAAAGNPGAGAAIGGATGLVGGRAVGANNAAAGQFDLQTLYNVRLLTVHVRIWQYGAERAGETGIPGMDTPATTTLGMTGRRRFFAGGVFIGPGHGFHHFDDGFYGGFDGGGHFHH